ncbi:CMRF35-like molecule 7 isoform X2 [Cervus elaphus]|uniref:CMRF35-like molecule 7 isoform X2 n=1 Tax=Cervus elaphus TaxID=9860 RepID=UPI001CC32C3B|nr:CMRF35-like molecule 7 isoform X2 [Cervus elaphus]
MWLPPALLLLSIPGCLSIRGPESVRGQERESVSVKCRYDSKWESHKKWWCRGAWWASCRILVQTQGSGREENGDRVSIRDDQRNRSFTVTLQELRQDDADTYWCGIERPGTDLGAQIKVTVGPREAALTVLGSQASRTRNTSRPAASSRPHSRCPSCSAWSAPCSGWRNVGGTLQSRRVSPSTPTCPLSF